MLVSAERKHRKPVSFCLDVSERVSEVLDPNSTSHCRSSNGAPRHLCVTVFGQNSAKNIQLIGVLEQGVHKTSGTDLGGVYVIEVHTSD